MENGIHEPSREPPHMEIPVIELELGHSPAAESGPEFQGETQEDATNP
jgi:hypothetical protein